MLKKIKKSTDYINKKIVGKPDIGIILGSGLGDFINEVKISVSIPYEKIPNFPKTTVDGHSGKLVFGKLSGKSVVIMQGRSHFYEGYSFENLTLPIRVLKQLGVSNLLISNAAGGMNTQFKIGDLILINDHINLIPNPLIGKHHSSFGERFVDMSQAYNKQLMDTAKVVANKFSIELKEGVYIAVTGPTYETPAEYKFFNAIGADMVGMSTVPEVIVAHQSGIKCLAISVITDLGIPGEMEYLTHEMVQEAAKKAEPKLAKLLIGVIQSL